MRAGVGAADSQGTVGVGEPLLRQIAIHGFIAGRPKPWMPAPVMPAPGCRFVPSAARPGYRDAVVFSQRLSDLVGCYMDVITDDVPGADEALPVCPRHLPIGIVDGGGSQLRAVCSR
jgi:hypothetical protein